VLIGRRVDRERVCHKQGVFVCQQRATCVEQIATNVSGFRRVDREQGRQADRKQCSSRAGCAYWSLSRS
jgi:hypothetical protein